MSKALVSIVMGSDSDLEIMREAGKALEEFGIAYEIDVTSAHRSPERTADFARKAAGRGIRVIIAGAGGAAQLAVVRQHLPAVLSPPLLLRATVGIRVSSACGAVLRRHDVLRTGAGISLFQRRGRRANRAVRMVVA